MNRYDCSIQVLGPAGTLVPKNVTLEVHTVRILVEVDGPCWYASCATVGLYRVPLRSLRLEEALPEALRIAAERSLELAHLLTSFH